MVLFSLCVCVRHNIENQQETSLYLRVINMHRIHPWDVNVLTVVVVVVVVV